MGKVQNINDLREHLFETLKDLRAPLNPMDIARAKAIAEVAQTIINSAKVEVQFLEFAGGQESKSEFLVPQSAQLPEKIRATAPAAERKSTA
jgi:hypothetical protein